MIERADYTISKDLKRKEKRIKCVDIVFVNGYFVVSFKGNTEQLHNFVTIKEKNSENIIEDEWYCKLVDVDYIVEMDLFKCVYSYNDDLYVQEYSRL